MSGQSTNLEEASAVAYELHELAPASCGKLERAKNSRSVTAPATGWIVARARVKPDGTWFYLDGARLRKLGDAGFTVKPFRQDPVLSRDKDKYIVQRLRAADVQQHSVLFKEVLAHSASVRDSRRSR